MAALKWGRNRLTLGLVCENSMQLSDLEQVTTSQAPHLLVTESDSRLTGKIKETMNVNHACRFEGTVFANDVFLYYTFSHHKLCLLIPH